MARNTWPKEPSPSIFSMENSEVGSPAVMPGLLLAETTMIVLFVWLICFVLYWLLCSVAFA